MRAGLPKGGGQQMHRCGGMGYYYSDFDNDVFTVVHQTLVTMDCNMC
jgi:hypothetical protein